MSERWEQLRDFIDKCRTWARLRESEDVWEVYNSIIDKMNALKGSPDSKPLPWLRAEEVTEPGPYLMWHPFFPKEVSAVEIIVVNDALYVGEVFNTDDSPLLGGPKGVRYQGPLKPELPKEES